MQIHLFISLILSLWLLPSTKCQYQKLYFTPVNSKITAITSCKIFSNTLYTTEDGVLHHWVFLLINNDYQIGGSSSYHMLECSRYAWNLNHVYVGVLDDKGTVKVWSEIFEQNIAIKSKLVAVDFKPSRQSKATDISVDSTYIAIGYQNITPNSTQSIIDIYNMGSLQEPVSLSFNSPYLQIKLDVQGNLAVIVYENGIVVFKYYIRPYLSTNGTVLIKELKDFNRQMKISIDYQKGEETQPYLIAFLISSASKSGFINFTKSQQLTDYQPLATSGVYSYQLCDHQLSSIVPQNQNSIQKQNNTIITLSQPITKFMCTTNTTQGQLWSMYFIASVDANNNYYIDLYWISKNYHILGIIGGVLGGLCCCACLCSICRACIAVAIQKKKQQRESLIDSSQQNINGAYAKI